MKYPRLDSRIAATYAAHSTATLQRNLYDSYIRAFRWASDRIGTEGIVCFVTNGAWLDSNTADGFRHELEKEFAAVYVFNLRGNARTQGEQRRKEAGNVFDSGSRTPVAITLLVKKAGHSGKAAIQYHDIGDYLTRENKLAKIAAFGDYSALPWTVVQPNEHDDWINQRNAAFNDFVPLNAEKETAIFSMRSLGVVTNRDAWCYNFSQNNVVKNIKNSIQFYNSEVDRVKCEFEKNNNISIEDIINYDKTKFSWVRPQLNDIKRFKKYTYNEDRIFISKYRPFIKEYMYFDRQLNNCVYRQPTIFPTSNKKNLVIQATGGEKQKIFLVLSQHVFLTFIQLQAANVSPSTIMKKRTVVNRAICWR